MAEETEIKNAAGDSAEPENFRKIFVGGLTANTSDETMREFYSQFGELTDIIVMRDPNTKRSRGFGFVTFATKGHVDNAMAARPHVIDGKTVDPKRAVPKDDKNRNESNVSTKRLYVSGVREEHNEQMFSDYFSKFGTVVKAEIILDKVTNKPRGFGFVTFDDYDAVDQCVLQRSHMINGFRCDVKKGLSKEEMAKAQNQRDRSDRMGRSRGDQRGGYGNANGGGWGGPRGSSGGGSGGGGYASQGSYNQGGYGGAQGGYGGGYGGSYGGSYGGQGGYGGGYGQGGWDQQGSWQQQQPQQPGGGWGQGGGQPQGWGQQASGAWGQSGAQQWANAQGGGRY